jgi:hypothetical protein
MSTIMKKIMSLTLLLIFYSSQLIDTTTCDFGILVDDCKELLKCIPQTKVQHCYKEANFCANALAKLGSSLDQPLSHFVIPL